jgi:hypothetical protein
MTGEAENKKPRKKDIYLKNNKELPVDVQIDWEPWQLEEFKKCKDDIIYFAENYFDIIHVDRGKEKMQLYEPQKRAILKIIDNRRTIICASRQIGKSSLMTVVCLWYGLFNKNKNIAILANKEQMAKELLARIKTAYRGLPVWLKAGVPEYTKESIIFSNESKIFASTTSADSIRGQAINLLFLDEFAFVPPEIAEEFFAAVAPTISSGESTKIVIVSTPNGASGMYYDIFSKAEKGENGWAWEKMYWHEIPGRTIKWRDEQLKMINNDMDKWNQEYELQFLNSGRTALNVDLIKRMKSACVAPKFSFDNGEYVIWEEPRKDRIYSVGVDVAQGTGGDYSIAHILDVTDPLDIRHCGILSSNSCVVYVFAERLNQVIRSWGRPFLCIERDMGNGAALIDALVNVHNYDNIVSVSKVNSSDGRYNDQIGIVSHQNSKLAGITNMRYYLETLESVNVRDLKTMIEFDTFVAKNNRQWSAMKGYHDDRIMSLVWGLFLLEKEVAEKYLDILETDETGRIVRIADPNQDLVNNLLVEGSKKVAYARLGGQPPPSIFQFGQISSYKDAEIAGYVNNGFTFV